MTQHNDALVDRIFDVLKKHPRGITAKQVSAEMNTAQARTSSRLGRLAMYGMIDRELLPAPKCKHRPGKEYSYRLKQHTNDGPKAGAGYG